MPWPRRLPADRAHARDVRLRQGDVMGLLAQVRLPLVDEAAAGR